MRSFSWFIFYLVLHWFCVLSQDITSEPKRSKSILFVAQKFPSVDVINSLPVDDSFKEFTDDTKDVDGSILRQSHPPSWRQGIQVISSIDVTESSTLGNGFNTIGDNSGRRFLGTTWILFESVIFIESRFLMSLYASRTAIEISKSFCSLRGVKSGRDGPCCLT